MKNMNSTAKKLEWFSTMSDSEKREFVFSLSEEDFLNLTADVIAFANTILDSMANKRHEQRRIVLQGL